MINLKNKRGEMVLRDIIFIIIIFTGIIAFSGIFVNEIGTSYSNTNMTTSYSSRTTGESNLNSTAKKFEEIGKKITDYLKEDEERGTETTKAIRKYKCLGG